MPDEFTESLSPLFVIPVGDGVIVPVIMPDDTPAQVANGKPECVVDTFGVMMTVGKTRVPLPVLVVEHLVKTEQKVHLYKVTEEQYVPTFEKTLTLDRDKLLKLLGTWEAKYGASADQSRS